MSRASAAIFLHAPLSRPPGFGPAWRAAWAGFEPVLARTLGTIGDCARIAWWDGSAVGLHLNGLLGLFEAEAPARSADREGHRAGKQA